MSLKLGKIHLFLSFIQIRFWHSQSYLIYILFFILLLGVKYFGLTSSGSKRWLDLYFMNLQPSELMKVGLILFSGMAVAGVKIWLDKRKMEEDNVFDSNI